ncbi:MAG: hypothetical protein ABSA93_34575 [Streptosporangiaceae bacterium]|jgi:ATP phosphoribosyltransferase
MPMRIAVPSPTSRLYSVTSVALGRLLSQQAAPRGRRLLESLPGGSQLVYCRGTDVATLVALGVADVGLTGYDMVAETAAGGGPVPEMRSLAPARASYVCLLMPENRARVSRIYTEYPNLTRAWLGHSRMFRGAEVVTLHGSLEGVVALDDQSAGVLLVTSGETARANGLDRCLPLMATDLCLIFYDATAQSLGGIAGLESLALLELPAFCRATAALHGLLRRRQATRPAYAFAQVGESRPAAR